MGKKLGVLGLMVAGVLVLGAASFGAATLVHATHDDERPARQELLDQFLSRVASKLGVSQEELSGAIESAELEMLDEAVAAGRIPEDAARRARERIEQGRGFLGMPVYRPHGQGGPRVGPRAIRAGLRLVVDPAAEVLGMERQELVAELRDGRSLAEIAEEQDLSLDELKSGVLEGAAATLEEAVSNGRLSEERADRILRRLTEHIDEIVSRTLPARFGGPPSSPEA